MAKDYIKKWNVSSTLRDKVTATLTESRNNRGYTAINISGNGAMKSYKYGKCPWYKVAWRDYIAEATIDEGVTTVGQRAFEGCKNLQTVTLPSTVNRFVAFCFSDCTSLKSIKIPEGVTRIGTTTFGGCSALETIELPSTLKSTGFNSFRDCISLKEITLPKGLTQLDDGTFYGCKALERAELPKSLEEIGDWVFSYTNLKRVDIPDRVTRIGEYAFCFCKGLQAIVIPEFVEEIGKYAFDNCSNLTIYCEAKEKPEGWHEEWNRDNLPVVWGHEIKRVGKKLND